MTDAQEIVRWHDFSLSPEPVVFKVGDEEFECLPEIPLDSISDMAKLAQLTNAGDGQLGKIYDFFDGIMVPESAARFRQRGARPTPDAPNPRPIGLRHIMVILPWLMEVYGLRPTEPSSDVSTGSDDDATSSTDGV
jgi:hypothetical protein